MRRFWHASFGSSKSTGGQGAGQRRTVARVLLLLTIGALCSAALVAIGILLFGRFGETEGKILLTVVGIGGYGLLGLAATTALGREPGWLGPVGLVFAAVGFVFLTWQLWVPPEGTLVERLMGTCLVAAVALAHAALLLLLTHRIGHGPVSTLRRATLAASSVLSVMIAVPLLSTWEPAGIYLRSMGAVAVLAVLGTLLVPIVGRLSTAPGIPKDPTVDGAMPCAAGDAPLYLRYQGRAFVVQVTRRDIPSPSLEVEAWEVTSAGREPVAGLADRVQGDDRHTALAIAVRHITRSVDEADRVPTPLKAASQPDLFTALRLPPDDRDGTETAYRERRGTLSG